MLPSINMMSATADSTAVKSDELQMSTTSISDTTPTDFALVILLCFNFVCKYTIIYPICRFFYNKLLLFAKKTLFVF